MAKAASIAAFNKTVADLQQQLVKSKAESQRLKDKLNCLIFLVKRSWKGDKNAYLHIANIIGIEAPPDLIDGFEGRPGTRSSFMSKSDAAQNWKRLALKLLEQEYVAAQQGLQKQQHQYIKTRSQYMDEVMANHCRDMASMGLRRQSSVQSRTLEDADRQFLLLHSKAKDLPGPVVQPLRKAKSATFAPRQVLPQEAVEQADVKLQDLFVEPRKLSAGDSGGTADFKTTSKSSRRQNLSDKETVKRPVQVSRPEAYNDSKRYLKGDLFSAEMIRGKASRPFSAALLREKDALRAQPRSVHFARGENQAFLTQKAARAQKTDSKRPASEIDPFVRRVSSSEIPDSCKHHTNIEVENPCPLPVDDTANSDFEENTSPHAAVQLKKAFHPLNSVDMSDDLKRMEEMGKLFERNTLALQKKIGLPKDGFV